jgi:hypothetical protein
VRILLDECVPALLKYAFPSHSVQSVSEAGYRASKDGTLLKFAQDRFDVFMTVDRKLEVQNNLAQFRLGFVVARVPNNRLEAFGPITEELNAAVETVRQGEILHVVSPRMRFSSEG